MKNEYKIILTKIAQQEKENSAFFKKLKKVSKKQLDINFHAEHENVFAEIDCLSCANCCKTTSPIFTEQDIKRLSNLFKMKVPTFITEYLRLDEEQDYVLKSSPCPFLNEDNTCFVYDVRPQACREYPHTNRKNMYQILSLTKTNSLMCPATAKIVEKMKGKLKL